MGSALAVAAASGSILAPASAHAQGSYIESPFLASRVEAGELPPIAERLPAEPFVVGPGVLLQEEYMTWEDGQHGGDLNIAAPAPSGFMTIGFGATVLRSPSQSTAASLPNIVSEFTPSEDFTSFTFRIREGLRWSDGQPVTTEDVRFTFEDVYQFEELGRPWPNELHTQGDASLAPATLSINDDYAFVLTFAAPYGYFVAALNSWIPGYDIFIKPAHYLKRFHAGHADEAELNRLVQENNQDSWFNLFNTKDVSHWECGEEKAFGLPVLNAWVLTEAGETRRVFERNPYYWHVDGSGRQLPYADRVINNMVVDFNAVTNAVLAGQVTIASGAEVSLNNVPVYQQNAEQAGLRLFLTGSFNNPIMLYLNKDYGYEDPANVWHQLVSDPDNRFVRAVAAAMDPTSINQAVYFGLYGDPFLNNTELNLELANQLLDELGMTLESGGTSRLGPNGQPFSFQLTNPNEADDFAPVAELIREQLAAAGLNVEIDNVSHELFEQRKQANEITASMHWNDGPGWPSGISEDYLPNHKGPWSPMTWMYYSTNGTSGREPTELMQEFYALHRERKTVPPESADGESLYAALEEWFATNNPFIPTAGRKTAVNVVDRRLRNVPNEGAPFELDTYINAEGVWFGEPQ